MRQLLGLCIGINDYPGTGSDLSGCVNDARDWAAELKARQFDVGLLLDRQATKQRMAAEILARVTAARAGDVVVIQYSGHGSYIPDVDGDEPDGTDEVLCPYDIGQNRPLSDDELQDIFSQRQAGVRVVLISDSCHSGTVSKFAPPLDGGSGARGRRGGGSAGSNAGRAARSGGGGRRTRNRGGNPVMMRVRFLPPLTFLRGGARFPLGMRSHVRPASPPGRGTALLMSGCQDTEFSYDASFGGRPNGAFSFAALRALHALPQNATYAQWYQRIRQALPTQQHPQTPNLYGTTPQKRWRVFQ